LPRAAAGDGKRFVAPLAFQFELVAMNKKVQGYKPNLWASRNTTTSGWRAEADGATKSDARDRRPPVAGAACHPARPSWCLRF
jgi:hypothetical protein